MEAGRDRVDDVKRPKSESAAGRACRPKLLNNVDMVNQLSVQSVQYCRLHITEFSYTAMEKMAYG